ncbi:helix-turn-helix domain-containing protein [Methanoculleus bourgensis]|jgi:excisionase family DNA binding protein|uniref:helix-turn-helix domain-containing protein n=1 Tax=Methanoculleus bourgensis TaxID=83986 RepID=UPI003A52349B
MRNQTEFTEFLSVATVAAILGIGDDTVRFFARSGELPAIWVGGQMRFPKSGLERYLIEQGLEPALIYRGQKPTVGETG